MYKYILASKSPRRKELLQNIGMVFDVIESDFDENTIPKNIEPKLYVQELALGKATSLLKNAPRKTLVIGADTVVCLDNKILGKPKDRNDAINMLKMLSGKVHQVYTGVCVARTDDGKTVSSYERTDVYFDEISEKDIEYYLDNFSVLDKAGAYGIQEYAGVFVNKIDGDYFNIVGLPVHLLHKIINSEFGKE